MLIGRLWAVCVLSICVVAADAEAQGQAVPRARTDVVTLRGTVHDGDTPVADITVKVIPYNHFSVVPSQGTTDAKGTFAVDIPLGADWQLLDVILEDHGIYRSRVVERRLARDSVGPRAYSIAPFKGATRADLGEILDDLDEVRRRGGDPAALLAGVRAVRALYPDEFAAASPLLAQVDRLAGELESGLPIVETIFVSSDVPTLSLTTGYFDYAALLLPGVTPLPQAAIDGAQYRTLNGVAVNGIDTSNTSFKPTGNDGGRAAAGFEVGIDALQELMVATSSMSEEFAQATAIGVRAVSRGTNQFHGSAFEHFGDTALTANNRVNAGLGRPTPPFHLHWFGGTLGGPIIRNRVFFMAVYEGQRVTHSNVTFLNLPASTPTDPATNAGLAILEPKAESWEREQKVDRWFLKPDLQLGTANHLNFTYAGQRLTGANAQSGGPQRSIENTGGATADTHAAAATLTTTLSPVLVNEARFQWSSLEDGGLSNSSEPEVVVFQDAAQALVIGRNHLGLRSASSRRWQTSNTTSWIRGPHTVKGGMTILRDDIRRTSPDFFSGAYTFRSIASFTGGRPTGPQEFYQQSFGGPGVGDASSHPDANEYALFGQDNWRVTSRLTLDAGLRYDLMTAPGTRVRNPDPQLSAAGIDTSRLATDANNVAPRVGVAWSPSERVVIRGGVGAFYGRVPSGMLSAAELYNGLNVIALTFTGDSVPLYPASFHSVGTAQALGATRSPTGVSNQPNIAYLAEHFDSARKIRANGGVDWELFRGTAVGVSYELEDGAHLARAVDRNVGPPTSQTYIIAGSGQSVDYHRFSADRPLNAFGRVIAFESSADSRYHGVTLELTRRYAHHLMFRGAYTFSKLTDTVPDSTATIPGDPDDDARYVSNPANPVADRAVGNTDRPHRVVLNGQFDTGGWGDSYGWLVGSLVKNWTVRGVLTAQSGSPFSARVGAADLNNDGNTRNDLAPGTLRNSFRLPGYSTLDLQVSRDIRLGPGTRLTLALSAFNVFNDEVVSGVDQTYYSVDPTVNVLRRSTNFGRPLLTVNERAVQLIGRLTF